MICCCKCATGNLYISILNLMRILPKFAVSLLWIFACVFTNVTGLCQLRVEEYFVCLSLSLFLYVCVSVRACLFLYVSVGVSIASVSVFDSNE